MPLIIIVIVIITDVVRAATRRRAPVPLGLYHTPICVTAAVFGSSASLLVVDPTLEEERAMDARISVAVNAHRELCCMHQYGATAALTAEQLARCVEIAAAAAPKLLEQLLDAATEPAAAASRSPQSSAQQSASSRHRGAETAPIKTTPIVALAQAAVSVTAQQETTAASLAPAMKNKRKKKKTTKTKRQTDGLEMTVDAASSSCETGTSRASHDGPEQDESMRSQPQLGGADRHWRRQMAPPAAAAAPTTRATHSAAAESAAMFVGGTNSWRLTDDRATDAVVADRPRIVDAVEDIGDNNNSNNNNADEAGDVEEDSEEEGDVQMLTGAAFGFDDRHADARTPAARASAAKR